MLGWASDDFLDNCESMAKKIVDVSIYVSPVDEDSDIVCVFAPVECGQSCFVARVWIACHDQILYKYSCPCHVHRYDGGRGRSASCNCCHHCGAVLIKAIDKYQIDGANLDAQTEELISFQQHIRDSNALVNRS